MFFFFFLLSKERTKRQRLKRIVHAYYTCNVCAHFSSAGWLYRRTATIENESLVSYWLHSAAYAGPEQNSSKRRRGFIRTI